MLDDLTAYRYPCSHYIDGIKGSTFSISRVCALCSSPASALHDDADVGTHCLMAIVILLYIAQIALIVPEKPAANLQDV